MEKIPIYFFLVRHKLSGEFDHAVIDRSGLVKMDLPKDFVDSLVTSNILTPSDEELIAVSVLDLDTGEYIYTKLPAMIDEGVSVFERLKQSETFVERTYRALMESATAPKPQIH